MSYDLQPTFRALADPTRRAILLILARREQTIGEVAEKFDMTRGAVKKHLTILEEGHLITVETRGRERINHLNPDAIRPAFDWLSFFETFWDTRLAALKDAVESPATERDRDDQDDD